MRKKYEKYSEEFYSQLLDYLEDSIPGLHWNNEFDLLGQKTRLYHWFIEDENDDTLYKNNGFLSKKEVVEDIFRQFKVKEYYEI